MFNKEIATVMVASKLQDKWVPVRFITQYGLFAGNIDYMESKGWINTTHHPEVGTMIKPTVDGYFYASKLLYTLYNKKGVIAQ